MLFRLYFWSIGPVSLIDQLADGPDSVRLFVTIYWPVLELVEHSPVVAERYGRIIETWWFLEWLFVTVAAVHEAGSLRCNRDERPPRVRLPGRPTRVMRFSPVPRCADGVTYIIGSKNLPAEAWHARDFLTCQASAALRLGRLRCLDGTK